MPAATAVPVILFAVVAGVPVCHVSVVLAGKLLAVIVVKFTVVAGHTLLIVVELNVGAVVPAEQDKQGTGARAGAQVVLLLVDIVDQALRVAIAAGSYKKSYIN